ncbi:winged helix-turn-helix transcriptional regulator [Haloglomus halophilum]|uniref:winged helix-turn-helix transcriptional regulator n=1 Tax=Haloglomus halophilum TaxID=2962672 RepID=UPI0020C9CDAC|nr:helix-turn-helix domain-containing protein [Haloglomus halophilum]
MTETRENATRRAIHDHVHERPGVHFNELTRVLDLAPGQVQYHLKRLTRADRVVAADLFGRTHYYPPEFDDWERAALALLHRETSADIVAELLAAGPLGASETAERVGIARSTCSWHVDRLSEAGVVRTERDGNRVVLALAEPERTARLLQRAEPSLPERLVDRFTRLVDSLLAE